MKKIRFILLAFLLITASSYYRPVLAQEKTKEEKEKELQLKKEIDDQKKALAEQKKAQEEAVRAFKDQQEVVQEAMKDAQKQIQESGRFRDLFRSYKGEGDLPRYEFNGQPFVFTPGLENFNWHAFGGDEERTSWDFTKSLKENSFTNEYTFDVEPTNKNVVMTVNGDCKAGDIRIKIITPNGKTYSDIVIDEYGNLNWRKSFTISEGENKDKVGEWKFKVDANKATGIFKISLQAY